MRLRRRDGLQRLAHEVGHFLGESADLETLQRVAPGKRAFLRRIGQPQRGVAQFMRVVQEIVDDDQGGGHDFSGWQETTRWQTYFALPWFATAAILAAIAAASPKYS